MRVGLGFDLHAFGPGNHVMLGGVRIQHSQGVRAHSDGDVVLHALCDALLGAAGLGDIGMHFPDGDPRWKGADSRQLIRDTVHLVQREALRVVNADITLIAQTPRLHPYRDAIRRNVAALLGLSASHVNVKATTTEGLGAIGRGEGLAAQAVVLLEDAQPPSRT
jgi:2-C-methyl-D-erythritol 2,4-cyclodiphosphate synthase